MADQRISQLASGAPAQGTDETVIARSGANYKLTVSEILGYLGSPINITNGGTGATDAATARANLGAGSVSSVGGTGTVNGITLTGTVTSSGNLTLGGTLSGVSLTTQVTGILPVANGGTGVATITGIVKGNGTSVFTAASAGTDYVAPGGALGTPSSGTLTNCTADGTNAVGFRKIPQSGSAKTTSYSLATGDVGKFIEVGASGSITIPDATFSAGDVVSIFNNTTGAITITCTITTAYIGGTNTDKASVSLATRGVATILFISGTVCVINGNVS